MAQEALFSKVSAPRARTSCLPPAHVQSGHALSHGLSHAVLCATGNDIAAMRRGLMLSHCLVPPIRCALLPLSLLGTVGCIAWPLACSHPSCLQPAAPHWGTVLLLTSSLQVEPPMR